MTSYRLWLIFFAVIYTSALVLVGTFLRRWSIKGDGYFVGGQTFNKWIVCFCITGLFSGSTFISVVELSYLTGISAAWYGVAKSIQILIIALVIIGPFRKKNCCDDFRDDQGTIRKKSTWTCGEHLIA